MFSIAAEKLGKEFKPYIIAELSANHGGSIERAKASILAAKNAGVSAVKIQSYTPDTMTIDCNKDEFKIKDGLWEGYSLYQLYSEAYTPFEWHKELFEYASRNGVTIFSTPFDETAVDLLENLNTPAYKIASFELTDLPLIEYVAKKQKPTLISTGMGSIDEVAENIKVDSLGYLSLHGTVESTSQELEEYCTACFSGEYPVSIEEKNDKKVSKAPSCS